MFILLQYTTDEHFLRPLTKTAQLMWKYTPLYFYIFSYDSNYGAEATRNVNVNKSNIQGKLNCEELTREVKISTPRFFYTYFNLKSGQKHVPNR